MADLIQFQEDGFQTPSGVDWYGGSARLVSADHRRRILDRDSIEPRPDGWAYETRHIADDLDNCTAVARIRWDNTILYTQSDLDRHMKGWAA